MGLVRMAPLAAAVWLGVLSWPAFGACPEDADADLCDEELPTSPASRLSPGAPAVLSLVLAGSGYKYAAAAAWLAHFASSVPSAAAASSGGAATCGEIKTAYKEAQCCGQPAKVTDMAVVKMPTAGLFKTTQNVANPCDGAKPDPGAGFDNANCSAADILEQSGANVTAGYVGGFDTDAVPWTEAYFDGGLCPVNVHWHLGTEHLSMGQFDEAGTGPTRRLAEEEEARRLAGSNVRLGFRCHHYDATDAKFTTEYNWQHCEGMHVGETYEVHWPHSAGGACGTPFQYQTPFYDGVFCIGSKLGGAALPFRVGVQAQIFTIVNDEDYFYADLMRGMLSEAGTPYGADMATYTGSTTGTSRDNEICSKYSPITWKVDRTCHLISASSFDKMCADMKMQIDDMSGDLHAHGSRELVADHLAADNLQRL